MSSLHVTVMFTMEGAIKFKENKAKKIPNTLLNGMLSYLLWYIKLNRSISCTNMIEISIDHSQLEKQ